MAIHTSRARGLLGGGTSILLAAALWGTTGTAQSVILDTAGPFSIGAARIVIGGLLLLVLASFIERGAAIRRLLAAARPDRRRVRLLIALGAISVAVYQTTFFASVATTGVAVGTAVTIGSGPPFAGLLAAALGKRTPSPRPPPPTGTGRGWAALVSGG